MNPNKTSVTDDARRSTEKTKKTFIIVFAALALLLAGYFGWKAISVATAEPQKNDFVHLDKQREILDTSIDAYAYMLRDYAQEYSNAYLEERSAEEKDAIKDLAYERFERESKIGRERLERMASSVALKDDATKSSFDELKKQYETAFVYYNQRLAGVTNVTRSVAGPCARLSKMNVAKESFTNDYIKGADACLGSLADSKRGSDRQVGALLSEIEGMVREQRALFVDVTKKEGLEKSAAKITALSKMLSINSRIATFQADYERSTSQQYEQLASKVNAADKAFKEAIAKHTAAQSAQQAVVKE